MKKKDYLKPTVQVVKLQHQAHLLQASVENYNWNDETEE